MFVIFHVTVYVLACFGLVHTVGMIQTARQIYRSHKHDEVMRRIAKLELESGLGLDYAKDWFLQQKPKLNKKDIIARRYVCIICGETYTPSYYSDRDRRVCSKHDNFIKKQERSERVKRYQQAAKEN